MFTPFDPIQYDFDIYSSTSKSKTFYICEIQGNNIKCKKCNTKEFIDSLNTKLVIPPLYKYLINSNISIDNVDFTLDDTISNISCFFVAGDLTTDPPALFTNMESTYFIDPTQQRQILSNYIKKYTTNIGVQSLFDDTYGISNAISGLTSSSSPSNSPRGLSMSSPSSSPRGSPRGLSSTGSFRQGIINPGANCYINALIQLLNDIPDFKTNIKTINTETAIPNEFKPIFTRYYELKMYQDMFNYSKQSTELETIWNSTIISMEEKLEKLDKILLQPKTDELNEIEQDILSSLYPCGNECNIDLKSQFRADIDGHENEIKAFIITLTPHRKKMLLAYLLQKFFKTIEGDNKISFEPLILPLLLFGDFEQHDTLDAFVEINKILDESTFFDTIKTTFTSSKYFIKDQAEFNIYSVSERRDRMLSTKTETNIVVNVNFDEGYNIPTDISQLLNAQSQPRIVPDSLLRNSLINDSTILQEYNSDYSSKENNNVPSFNAFTQDIISDTQDYIVVCLIRESGDGQSINKVQVDIVNIEIDGKIYEPIGVLVRTGDVGAGHFYYVDIIRNTVYNDGHVYVIDDPTEMLTNWRLVLYKNSAVYNGGKRKKFRVSRRKKIKSL